MKSEKLRGFVSLRNTGGLKEKYVSQMRETINKYPELISTPEEKSGKTALHQAIEYNSEEVVTLLFTRFASPQSQKRFLLLKDHKGWGAIHYAAGYASVEIFRLTMGYYKELGQIPLESTTRYQETPLEIAQKHRNKEVVSYIQNLMKEEKEAEEIRLGQDKISAVTEVQGTAFLPPNSLPSSKLNLSFSKS